MMVLFVNVVQAPPGNGPEVGMLAARRLKWLVA